MEDWGNLAVLDDEEDSESDSDNRPRAKESNNNEMKANHSNNRNCEVNVSTADDTADCIDVLSVGEDLEDLDESETDGGSKREWLNTKPKDTTNNIILLGHQTKEKVPDKPKLSDKDIENLLSTKLEKMGKLYGDAVQVNWSDVAGGITFSCKVCNVKVYTELTFSHHMNGKRHKETLKAAEEQKTSDKGVEKTDDTEDKGVKRKASEEVSSDKKSKNQESINNGKLPAASATKPKYVPEKRNENRRITAKDLHEGPTAFEIMSFTEEERSKWAEDQRWKLRKVCGNDAALTIDNKGCPQYTCRLCNIAPSSLRNFQTHIESGRHRMLVQDKKNWEMARGPPGDIHARDGSLNVWDFHRNAPEDNSGGPRAFPGGSGGGGGFFDNSQRGYPHGTLGDYPGSQEGFRGGPGDRFFDDSRRHYWDDPERGYSRGPERYSGDYPGPDGRSLYDYSHGVSRDDNPNYHPDRGSAYRNSPVGGLGDVLSSRETSFVLSKPDDVARSLSVIASLLRALKEHSLQNNEIPAANVVSDIEIQMSKLRDLKISPGVAHDAPPSGYGGRTDEPSSGYGGRTDAPSSGYGGRTDAPPSGYGGRTDAPPSGYGGRIDAPPSKYGGRTDAPPSGYSGRTDAPPSGYGGRTDAPPSGYGGRTDAPPSGYGGMTDKPLSKFGGITDAPTSGFGGRTDAPTSGYGGMSSMRPGGPANEMNNRSLSGMVSGRLAARLGSLPGEPTSHMDRMRDLRNWNY